MTPEQEVEYLTSKIKEQEQYLDMWKPLLDILAKENSTDETSVETVKGIRDNIVKVEEALSTNKAKQLLAITKIAK